MRPRTAFLAGFFSGIGATLLLAVLGIAAAAYYLKDDMVARKAERLKPPPIGAVGKADYAWSVVDADGAPHAMTEFAGRPVFLQFWSPSCTACEAEIPAVNQLHAAIKDKGVHVVAVAADTEPGELKSLAASLGIDYPIYAMSGTLPEVFQFTAGPVTFLLNHEGDIVYKHIGAARWDDPQVLAHLALLASSADNDTPAE
jgi:thiol-disulfide isomerase/thioredoxin